jgi:predicted dehydrogenase
MKSWIDGFEERAWQTTTDGTVRYALVGLGWWTIDFALPAIEASDLGKVTTLVSSSTEKAERLAADSDVRHGISYDEFHDGAVADAYDAVYVGTPNACHLEYVETAADFDKAVLCEKPMEATVERAKQVIKVAERGGIPLMIAYRMHTDPVIQRVKELIDDGFVGDPVSVYGNNSQPLLQMIPDHKQWRLDPDRSGYGTSVMDLGIYSINTARYLLNREPVAVQSHMSSHHEAFGDVPDERSSAMIALEGGVNMITTESQNAYENTQLKITGTEGIVDLRPAFHGECHLHLSRGDLTVSVKHEGFGAQQEMLEEFDYFADRILSDAEIHPNGRHGLQDMRIIAAIHEAAETAGVVEL